MQNLVPDEVSITMIPNQKDGMPGPVSEALDADFDGGLAQPTPPLRRSSWTSSSPTRRPTTSCLIERGVSGDASVREQITGKLSETEKKIIDYLDVVATSVCPLPPPPPQSAGEFDRALAPAWESVAFKKVDPGQAAKEYYENAKPCSNAPDGGARPWPQRP